MAKRLLKPSVFAGEAREAAEVASKTAAKLVTAISKETEANLRNLITMAIRQGMPVYDAARAIRGMIGLNQRQGQATMNYRSRLIEMGTPIARVDRLVQRYADRQLRLRAETIARTEVMSALNQGQLQSWKQAKKDGLLGKNPKKEWSTTDNACPICGPMDGQQVPLEGSFGIADPPVHPRCRCTVNLIP